MDENMKALIKSNAIGLLKQAIAWAEEEKYGDAYLAVKLVELLWSMGS